MTFSIFADLAPDLPRTLDPWEERDLADVMDAAYEWQAGRLPLSEFARVGMIRDSPAYTRYLCMLRATPEHRRVLAAAIDALIAADPRLKVTDQGVFNRWDLLDAGLPV